LGRPGPEFQSERAGVGIKNEHCNQSYGYEDFVQGIRPKTNEEGQIAYEIQDGIFKRLCERARQFESTPFVMVVDEINRGNLSRVFGELLLLLEYRDREVLLPYAEGDLPFSIPPNVYLIGTMNTADRSLAQIDYALWRVFIQSWGRPVAFVGASGGEVLQPTPIGLNRGSVPRLPHLLPPTAFL